MGISRQPFQAAACHTPFTMDAFMGVLAPGRVVASNSARTFGSSNRGMVLLWSMMLQCRTSRQFSDLVQMLITECAPPFHPVHIMPVGVESVGKHLLPYCRSLDSENSR